MQKQNNIDKERKKERKKKDKEYIGLFNSYEFLQFKVYQTRSYQTYSIHEMTHRPFGLLTFLFNRFINADGKLYLTSILIVTMSGRG